MDKIHKICVDKTSCKHQNEENVKEIKETSTPPTKEPRIHEICVDKTDSKHQTAENHKKRCNLLIP